MVDDRDFSWMGRSADPPSAATDRRLAAMRKDSRTMEFFEREHPMGRELRCGFCRGDPRFDDELRTTLDGLLAVG